jgi:hypothetical protein
MARPKKTGLDYFPHDTAATTDDKVAAMRLLFGNDGYAFYFMLLEMIYAAKTASLDLTDKTIFKIVRKRIGVDEGLFEEMIFESCKIGLFDKAEWEERKHLTSKRVKKTFTAIEKDRKRKRISYRRNAGETPPKPPRNATRERKEKESNITPLPPQGEGVVKIFNPREKQLDATFAAAREYRRQCEAEEQAIREAKA